MKKLIAAVLFCSIMLFSVNMPYAGNNEQLAQNKEISRDKIKIVRLSKKDFINRYGHNNGIPRTDAEVIKLSERLYSKTKNAKAKEPCGEADFSNLYASLSNPDISNQAVNTVLQQAASSRPNLPQTYQSGNVRIFYTTNDSNAANNVTFDNIVKTAFILNKAWLDFNANFKEPKGFLLDGVRTIDVYVYDLPSYLGVTSSYWDYIELDSQSCVMDNLNRQTTPVHELFHRVQYSYGYDSGIAMNWAVEGTAEWSQKYMASSIGDWKGWANNCLQNTDKALISNRSYDAVLFWIYLTQRTSAIGVSEKEFIKRVWTNYSTGNDMKSAVLQAIKSSMGTNYTFNTMAIQWMLTNYYKDMTNAPAQFDYIDDETTLPGGGPLYHITPVSCAKGTTTGTVSSYGADYLSYSIPSTVGNVSISATGSNYDFAFCYMLIKNGSCVSVQYPQNGCDMTSTYNVNFAPGSVDKVVAIVMGVNDGGNYTLNTTF